jgi:O-antigen ligase
VGLGGYEAAAHSATPASFSYLSTDYQIELRKEPVHNKYLLVVSESGLVGLALFLLLLWRHFRLLFPIVKWRNPAWFALALGLCSSIVGQAIFYLFDHFYVDSRMEMLWVCFAILRALAAANGGAREPAQRAQMAAAS